MASAPEPEPLLNCLIWVKQTSRLSCLPHSSPHPQTSLNSSSVVFYTISSPRRAPKCSFGTSLAIRLLLQAQTSAISTRLGSLLSLSPAQPQTSRKSLSGSWLPFYTTSTPSHAPFWVLFWLISVLPPLCHGNHPQTSAISARQSSFAVSVTSSKPRRATRARLGPGSPSVPPRHFLMPRPFP